MLVVIAVLKARGDKMVGTRERSDCSAASVAMRRQRSSFWGLGFSKVRSLKTGAIQDTPSSVEYLTISSNPLP